jgi:ArsR family transcriptional regulator
MAMRKRDRKKHKAAAARGEDAEKAAAHKAGILKALAHPTRVTIFEALAEREMTVGGLVDLMGTKDANTSRHLALMRSAGLVSARKDGLNVYYSVKMPCLVSVLDCLDEAVCTIADEHRAMAACIKR